MRPLRFPANRMGKMQAFRRTPGMTGKLIGQVITRIHFLFIKKVLNRTNNNVSVMIVKNANLVILSSFWYSRGQYEKMMEAVMHCWRARLRGGGNIRNDVLKETPFRPECRSQACWKRLMAGIASRLEKTAVRSANDVVTIWDDRVTACRFEVKQMRRDRRARGFGDRPGELAV